VAAGGAVLCGALIAAGRAGFAGGPTSNVSRMLNEPVTLLVAALIGTLVTAVHRPHDREQNGGRMLAHAQVLLCVSGALMMLIIQDSLARAFGIAGAASIIRFRTPVEDPKDAAVLFLLMALGMATGLGVLTLAGSGAALLCLFLHALGRRNAPDRRALLVEVAALGRDFPTSHVRSVFARHGLVTELREISRAERCTARYLAMCPPAVSLDALNDDLIAGGESGIVASVWEPARRKGL
jgi:hypothetical protein